MRSIAEITRTQLDTAARTLTLRGTPDKVSLATTLIHEIEQPRGEILLELDILEVNRNLARQIGVKSVAPCAPEVANRHSGYLVGGTSPFATRKRMPVYVERSILGLPRIWINGGRRGYLVGIDPEVCTRLLGAKPVDCALAD